MRFARYKGTPPLLAAVKYTDMSSSVLQSQPPQVHDCAIKGIELAFPRNAIPGSSMRGLPGGAQNAQRNDRQMGDRQESNRESY